MSISRRKFLKRAGILGCSAAASPFLTPMSFAAMPSDNRLVVIILRGGMDGLDVVQPYGDPAMKGLRPTLKFGEAAGASDLGGFFSMHAGLADLMPLWAKGELAFAHAVSTPYRDKRSHFDGQDLLEAGLGMDALGHRRDGWLNRMLQVMPEADRHSGFAVGREEMLVLTGRAPVSNWSPDTHLNLSARLRRLLEQIYHDDPLFNAAVNEAIELAEVLDPKLGEDAVSGVDAVMMQQQMIASLRGGAHKRVASFAANRLREETRVAAFSIYGWDTHSNQKRALKDSLTRLADTISILKQELSDIWGQTAVLAMTEFGRTVRENGTRGTDHGTGGLMLLAGGAIAGGKVFGEWPGLSEGELYQGRDLRPVMDLRAVSAAVMRGLFGLERKLLEGAIFPGLDMAGAPEFTL
ncbi:DUF1501 domain-containing protein [Profundibacter sp.]